MSQESPESRGLDGHYQVKIGRITPFGLTQRDLPYIPWAALPYFLAMCSAVILIAYSALQ